MDSRRFDEIARALAGTRSRRNVLRLLAGNAAVGMFAHAGLAAPARCAERGKPCERDSQCCSGSCDRGEGTCAGRDGEERLSAAAIGATCTGDADCGAGETCKEGTCQASQLVRRDVYGILGQDPNGLASFARGVAEMKTRPSTDPTSWIYQADMHGTIGQRCQHGTFFFLSWHRMYLYWFERILRAASGDPNLTVPYWNYADPGSRALPEPLRLPADAAENPLYVFERSAAANRGDSASSTTTDHSNAFAQANFFHTVSGELSFGGMRVSAPTHSGNNRGLLEATPHGSIHNWVGGRYRLSNGTTQPGWMATIKFAPRDPIFWLHHSNLDRLWQRWLEQGGGRANPTDDDNWMDDRFTFWDENGAQVVMTGREVVDAAGQLDYGYDDNGGGGITAARTGDATRTQTARTRVIGSRREAKALVLGKERVDVPIALSGSVPDVAGSRGGALVVLTIDGIRGEGMPGASFDVYLNLPAGARPNPQGDLYVGSISLFGVQPWDDRAMGHADHGGKRPSATQSFDITDAVRSLQAGEGETRDLTVTFVPVDLAGSSGPPPGSGPWASVERVTVKAGGGGTQGGGGRERDKQDGDQERGTGGGDRERGKEGGGQERDRSKNRRRDADAEPAGSSFFEPAFLSGDGRA